MFDYHMHSSVSFDGNDDLCGMAGYAFGAGLSEICFTEHIEIGHTYGIDWDGRIPFEDYSEKIEKARTLFPALTIKKGMEAGLSAKNFEQTKEYLKQCAPDFVIASVHIVDGKDPYDDKDFFNGGAKEAIRRYLEAIAVCVRGMDYYNVVGHIGYAARYANPPFDLQYADFSDVLDDILRFVIQNGKGIEVNTTGYYSFPEPHPSYSIIERYLELGGEILTIGSDAHFAGVIGHKFAETREKLKAMGAKYLCTYDAMKPTFHKL